MSCAAVELIESEFQDTSSVIMAVQPEKDMKKGENVILREKGVKSGRNKAAVF